MSSYRTQLHRIRRHLWVVAVTATLSVGVVLSLALAQKPTYTGTSALTAVVKGAPDQDAAFAHAYVEYFNLGSYQEILRMKAGIPADVTLSARAAASGPIIFVQAVAAGSAIARSASARAAIGFRDDIRSNLGPDAAEEIEVLQPNAGVSVQEPSPRKEGLLALVGGLMLGCVVALSLAALEGGPETPQHVPEAL